MGLKLEVAALSEVPQEVQSLYRESNGKFVLDADGLEDVMSAKAKVAEFRQNNIELMKKLEAAKSSSGGLSDVEKQELDRLKGLEKEHKSSQRVPLSEMDERVAARTKQLHEEFSGKLSETEKLANEFRARFEQEKVGNALRTAAVRSGVLPEALDDVMSRASNVFKLYEDEITAFNKDELLYGADGKKLTVDEWLDKLSLSAKHLFSPNSGSGAKGSSSTSGRVNRDKLSSVDLIKNGLAELQRGYK